MKTTTPGAVATALPCTILCALFLFIPVLRATTVLAPNFQTMVTRADLIFTGRATAQHAEWRNIDGQRSIVTLVTFEVLSVHKGQTGRSIELQFLGGTIGQTTLDVAEIPKFKPGERAVLFVENNGLNASPLVGFYHGKFPLQADGAGRDIVVGQNGPLADPAEIGRRAKVAHTPAEALTHEQFTKKIREAARRPNQ